MYTYKGYSTNPLSRPCNFAGGKEKKVGMFNSDIHGVSVHKITGLTLLFIVNRNFKVVISLYAMAFPSTTVHQIHFKSY